VIYTRLHSATLTLYSPFRWYLPDINNSSSELYKMAAIGFAANNSVLGTPDFKKIHINPEEVAKALQVYLNSASKLTGVSLDDISTGVISLPPDSSKATLTDLLERGMKLFDAIVWLSANRPTSHPLLLDPTLTRESIPSLAQIADSVFYCYFMLIVQARYPVSKNESDKPKIPNFLKTIMGLDAEQHVYVDRICTFEPQKFDPKWARYVKFENFGQEVLSRFGLGVAGYRNFGPFRLYKPRQDMDDSLSDAFAFAKKIASSRASWSVHPLTRNPDVLTRRGNLNKNLANLMLDAFTTEQLEEMKAARIIYKVPDREPNHRNYYQWTPEDDISGNDLIFS